MTDEEIPVSVEHENIILKVREEHSTACSCPMEYTLCDLDKALRLQREEFEKEISLLGKENAKNSWNADILQNQKRFYLKEISILKDIIKSNGEEMIMDSKYISELKEQFKTARLDTLKEVKYSLLIKDLPVEQYLDSEIAKLEQGGKENV